MNFQKTTQYALKVLSHMSIEPDRSYAADQLNEETKNPKRYLRRLMTGLAKAGFLQVTRGRSGGFSFARDISTISLYEIIESQEKETFRDKCILGFTFCLLDSPCAMHEEWLEARLKTAEVLKKTTLGSLRNKYFIVKEQKLND
jgi:Rrf2 family transcriptional regulator, iron-sulfur cluster assembly transcription factor